MKTITKPFFLVLCLVCSVFVANAQEEKTATEEGTEEVAEVVENSDAEIIEPTYLPPPPNFESYYIDLLNTNEPNEKGEYELIQYVGKDYEKKTMFVDPKEVYHLYVLGIPTDEPISFPTIVYVFPNLRTLYLGNLFLMELPNDMGKKFANLEYLDLQATPIKKVPKSILNLKYLKNLNLVGTKVPKAQVATMKESLPESCMIFAPN